jgi:hypothetical protein
MAGPCETQDDHDLSIAVLVIQSIILFITKVMPVMEGRGTW